MSTKADSMHSFVDLFISLALIFILLLVATMHKLVAGSKNTKNELKTELKNELKSQNVVLVDDTKDPFSEIIRIDENLLKFDLDKAQLKNSGVVLIDNVFEILTRVLSEDKYKNKIESVIVEGHTDVTGTDLHNIELSQARAFSVMKEAFTSLKNDDVKKSCLRQLVCAVGRGSSVPVDGPDGVIPEKNRRVEIKIRIKPDQELIKTLQ